MTITENNFLNEVIKRINLNNSIKWIVILPGAGCNGCIQEGEAFLKEYVKNEKVTFILTNISSLKILEQKIGLKVKEYPNIYIDKENNFYLPTENCIYPCIIEIKNSSILKHEFQSPINSFAFKKLKESIKFNN